MKIENLLDGSLLEKGKWNPLKQAGARNHRAAPKSNSQFPIDFRGQCTNPNLASAAIDVTKQSWKLGSDE